MANHLRNIKLKDFRKFLKANGCKHIRTNGGHDIWVRSDLQRPITIQNHIDPVPERIVKQALNALNVSKDKFWEMIKK